MSPGLASPSAPSEQLIIPLSGAVSGGQIGTKVIVNNIFNQLFFKGYIYSSDISPTVCNS